MRSMLPYSVPAAHTPAPSGMALQVGAMGQDLPKIPGGAGVGPRDAAQARRVMLCQYPGNGNGSPRCRPYRASAWPAGPGRAPCPDVAWAAFSSTAN